MEVERNPMGAFDLVETISGFGMLVALVVLVWRRRYWLVIVGVVVTVGSFPAYRWLREAYGSDSWQVWVFRVAGIVIAALFIWLAIREHRGPPGRVAPAPKSRADEQDGRDRRSE